MNNILYICGRIAGSNYPVKRYTERPSFLLCSVLLIVQIMKEINLTQGKFAQVDDEDFEYLSQWKWCAHNKRDKNHNYYAVRQNWFNGKSHLIKMHRVIMNTPDNMQVDHKDRNGLNNQKSNLRFCTRGQNSVNRVSYGVLKLKGVRSHGKKYTLNITINKKVTYFGTFDTKEDAARKHDEIAKIIHGEFAVLNY